MTANCKKPAFCMLFLIATPKLVRHGVDLLKEGRIPVQYLFHAQGTATSEVMDMLGFGGEDKNVLISIMPRPFADRMLWKMRNRLQLGMPNTGVAFTVALSGGSGSMIQLMDGMHREMESAFIGRDEFEMDSGYNLIMVIVNQGYSEEVMEAARPMGAAGGTVFHSRRIGSEEAMKFWGIRVQQEREIVLILAQKEKKRAIMQAVGRECGMHSEAHGIVLSLPVDSIVGVE